MEQGIMTQLSLGRFKNIDRLAEKYQSMTPYHFTAGNPIYFREINGDSINASQYYLKDDKGNYINKNQKNTLEFFASTKAGKAYLSKFAKAGQSIGDVTFNEDGEFHTKKIDLNFDTNMSANDGRDGETSVDENNNFKTDKNGRLQIDISLKGGDNESYGNVKSLTHEFFIHAMYIAEDFKKDGKINYDNIMPFVKKSYLNAQYHHYQEYFKAKDGSTPYKTYGYNILIQANNKFKKFKTNGEVWNSMWQYSF